MQGDCAGASLDDLPKLTPGLAPLKLGQCVVLGHEDLMAFATPDIWVDNLYLRTHFKTVKAGVTRETTFIGLAAVGPLKGPRMGTATRYFTNMTFQGDDKGPTMGLFSDEPTYIESTCLTQSTICTYQVDDHHRWRICVRVFT